MKDANTTLCHLDNFINTKNKLESYGIPVEDTDKFTRCVQDIKNYSGYDPFKVIEKFSDLNVLEIEIQNSQKIKSGLEINIQKLKEIESEYDDRLNIKYIKLKNLDELEKTGFTIQDLKKLKRRSIEIASEHKNLNIEQIKVLFFNALETIEDKIALENENNSLLQLRDILQNQIKSNRQTLHCQEVVGPYLKNLFEYGITEYEIVALKTLLDILLYYSPRENDITKINGKYENLVYLFNNSNFRNEYEKLKWAFNLILVLNLSY